jgi:hypothetical protein
MAISIDGLKRLFLSEIYCKVSLFSPARISRKDAKTQSKRIAAKERRERKEERKTNRECTQIDANEFSSVGVQSQPVRGSFPHYPRFRRRPATTDPFALEDRLFLRSLRSFAAILPLTLCVLAPARIATRYTSCKWHGQGCSKRCGQVFA